MAVRRLLDHGRAFAVVEALGLRAGEASTISVELVAETLERAMRAPENSESAGQLFYHNVVTLLDLVRKSGTVSDVRIAQLEWGFFPILELYDRSPEVLHRELARNPDFFSQVASALYRAEQEDAQAVSEEGQARAEQAHRLLESWDDLPGVHENGTVDSDALRKWVLTSARS